MSDTLLDHRDPGFFIIDNEIIEVFGAKLGVYGVAVYNVIVKYANENGENAFPSYQTIADLLGMSRPKAVSSVKLLVECGLIEKTPRYSASGDQTTNIYTLMNVKKLAGGSKPDLPPSKPRLPPSKRDLPPPSKQDLPPSKPRLHDQDPFINTQLDQEGEREKSPSPSLSHPEVDFMDTEPEPPVETPPRRFDLRKFVNGRVPAGKSATPAEVFYEIHHVKDERCILTEHQLDTMTREVTDLARWRYIVSEWALNDFKPSNIKGQLEWYKHGIPDKYASSNGGNHASRSGNGNGNGAAPTGRTAAGPPIAPFTWAEHVALQERIAQLPEDERPPY